MASAPGVTLLIVCVCVCVCVCMCVCVCVCVCEDKSDSLQSVVHFNTTDVSTDVHTPYWFIMFCFHHLFCTCTCIWMVNMSRCDGDHG